MVHLCLCCCLPQVFARAGLQSPILGSIAMALTNLSEENQRAKPGDSRNISSSGRGAEL